MSVSPIDPSVYGGLFTTPAMRAVFADEARLQRMLDVEAALARAQAKLGLIPAEAALEITAKADVSRASISRRSAAAPSWSATPSCRWSKR